MKIKLKPVKLSAKRAVAAISTRAVLSKIEWCAVQGLNLQKPHLRRCLPVVLTMFHCHSLPVE